MLSRDKELQAFLDAAHDAFRDHANDPQSQRSIRQIFAALNSVEEQRAGEGRQLPACQYLDTAMTVTLDEPSLIKLMETFRTLLPRLDWRRRANTDGSASANYEDGHANTFFVGPGGLEQRSDVWIGLTLLAPNVRYPDHDHAPEEVYLVLSEGEFRQADGEWFSPGIGGSFYNVPKIKHAMRSGNEPLFAFWALLVNKPDHETL